MHCKIIHPSNDIAHILVIKHFKCFSFIINIHILGRSYNYTKVEETKVRLSSPCYFHSPWTKKLVKSYIAGPSISGALHGSVVRVLKIQHPLGLNWHPLEGRCWYLPPSIRIDLHQRTLTFKGELLKCLQTGLHLGDPKKRRFVSVSKKKNLPKTTMPMKLCYLYIRKREKDCLQFSFSQFFVEGRAVTKFQRR